MGGVVDRYVPHCEYTHHYTPIDTDEPVSMGKEHPRTIEKLLVSALCGLLS